ncbi:hypothetical protein QW131_08930 [Roseibium salinum]|nr:hypothetical protein [Roseibium salinum]
MTNVERFAFADGIVLAGDLIAEDVSAVSDTDSADNTIAEKRRTRDHRWYYRPCRGRQRIRHGYLFRLG